MDNLIFYIKQAPVIQLILIASVVTSCAGRLDRPNTPDTINVNQPNIHYTYDEFQIDYDQYENEVENNQLEKARVTRDEIINRIRVDIDLNYREYVSQLFLNKAEIDFVGDVTELGLAFATTITGTESAKTVLAAISTLFIGTRLSFNKNFFREKTTEIIITKMEANRDSVKNDILKKMVDLDVQKYSFEEAWVDLIDLFYAGTLQGAIQALTAEVGKDLSDEREASKKLTLIRTFSAEQVLQLDTIRKAFISLSKQLDLVKGDSDKTAVEINKVKAALKELKVELKGDEIDQKLLELLNMQITSVRELEGSERQEKLKKLTDAFNKSGIIQ